MGGGMSELGEKPFLVFGLPRSRTAWLSHFLASSPGVVGHDTAIDCRTIGEFISQFYGLDRLAGTCETGAMMAWRVIKYRMPEAKLVVIQRPTTDVAFSLGRVGLYPGLLELEQRKTYLEAISRLDGVKTFSFHQLARQDVCEYIYEFCNDEPCPEGRWAYFAQFNIQVEIQQRMKKLKANAEAIAKLKASVMKEVAMISAGEQCLRLS